MRYRLTKCKELLKPGMVLICALIFLGCIGIGMPANSEAAGEDRYYEVDFDTVWNAAIAAFHEGKFIIRLMNKKEGYVAADWLGDRSRDHVGIRFSEEYGLIKVSINMSGEYLEYNEKTKTYSWRPSSLGSKDAVEALHDGLTSKVNILDYRWKQWKGSKEGKESQSLMIKAKEELASHVKKAQNFLEEFSAFVDKNAEKGSDTVSFPEK